MNNEKIQSDDIDILIDAPMSPAEQAAAKARAEAEAKARAAAAAKARAEAEAKARAEAEAKAREEAQARAREEELARARAEAEKAKAEAAKAQAEAAKLQAEADKLQAEAAKAQAEAAAKAERSGGGIGKGIILGPLVLVALGAGYFFLNNSSEEKAPVATNRNITTTAPAPTKPVSSSGLSGSTTTSSNSRQGIYKIEDNTVILYNQNKIKYPSNPFSKYIYLKKTNDPNYYRYVNGRYGFSIRVPAHLTIATEPINGDGATFSSADGRTQLVVYSHYEPNSIDYVYQEALIKRERTTGPKNPYADKGGTWFVVTWEENEITNYRKSFIKNNLNTTMVFSYPKAFRPTHSIMIDNMEADFKPGARN